MGGRSPAQRSRRTEKDGGRGEVNKNNLWKNAVTKPITLYDTITYKK